MAVAMLSPFLLGSGLLKVDDLALSVLGYVEIGVEVGGGGISFDWLGQLEVEGLVDELPAGDVSPIYEGDGDAFGTCLLYTSPSPRDKRQSRMPSSA